MPAPSEEGFRAVSSDASCRFAVSGRRSDCTTRQSVAYRASPPKNGDTGSVLNRSRQSVKRIWGPLLFLRRRRRRKKKKKKDLTPEGSGQWGPPEVERSTPHFTVSVSLRCLQGTVLPTLPPRVLQGQRSPATHISRSTRKRSGLGMPAPSEEGFRAVSSDASCRFAVSERRSDCTTTYKSRNQSREAGTSSRILSAWKLLPNISRWVLQIIENGGVFHQGGPPAGSGNGTGNKSSVRERGHRICTSLQQGNRVLQPVFHSSKRMGVASHVRSSSSERMSCSSSSNVNFETNRVTDQIRGLVCHDRSQGRILSNVHRKFLRFAFGGKAYQYRVLPFGLALSPALSRNA